MEKILASNSNSNVLIELLEYKRVAGIAGQYSAQFAVRYTYPNNDSDTFHSEFVSSIYGGPVTLVSDNVSVYVSRDVVERCGGAEDIDLEWIANFYGVYIV